MALIQKRKGNSTRCQLCGFEPQSHCAKFCSRCGGEMAVRRREAEEPNSAPYLVGGRCGPARPRTLGTWFAFLLGTRRWLAKASDPINSPILNRPRLSENAKRVYIYLAGIIYSFGSSHSRINTIARNTGLSPGAARKAITELERGRLLSHRARRTWHGRGAHDYQVKRVR